MFDGKIDFMDFNKIKINYGGKLTCRKIFRGKYIIFLIISIICLIFLVSLLLIKNKKITDTSIEIKTIEDDITQIEQLINTMKNKNMNDEIRLSEQKNKIETLKNEIREKNKKEQEYKKRNEEITKQKEELEKKSVLLSTQLKTEMELQEVYDQKNASLTNLLESLKIEYDKLVKQKGGSEEKTIEDSKIVTPEESLVLKEKLKIKDTTVKKCFDGVETNFNPFIFHEKCDKSALLLLIKTDNNERIGAYTKVSLEGLEIKRDTSSIIFNFDKNHYYSLANMEYSTIVCDPNELPQFGYDLQIKSNGQGINSFPFNYGDKDENYSEELTEEHVFKIENLEVYKINF